ncbi:protein argonaute-2 [Anopheles nili]|uniref:protein argonaute-2 n=1 Tax=Anopheles nili TaxID=185578 RepID=UPI00237AB553|nr:protein argonaute-2 [Anopheles nili]
MGKKKGKKSGSTEGQEAAPQVSQQHQQTQQTSQQQPKPQQTSQQQPKPKESSQEQHKPQQGSQQSSQQQPKPQQSFQQPPQQGQQWPKPQQQGQQWPRPQQQGFQQQGQQWQQPPPQLPQQWQQQPPQQPLQQPQQQQSEQQQPQKQPQQQQPQQQQKQQQPQQQQKQQQPQQQKKLQQPQQQQKQQQPQQQKKLQQPQQQQKQQQPQQQQQQQPQKQPQQQQPQQQQKQQQPQQQQKQQQPQQQQKQQQPQQQQKQQQPQKQNTPGGNSVHRDVSVASTSSSHSDGSLKGITENIENIRVTKEKVSRKDLMPVLSRRGAHGTRGKPVTVEANFFRLLVDKLIGTAYHYDVAIDPDRPKKFFRPVFAQFCKEHYPGVPIAFDGQKNAYTSKLLTDKKEKLTYQPNDGGKAKEYTVQVKQAAQVDLGTLKTYMTSNDTNLSKPMAAIQCLDVVLRCAYENNPNFVRFKRSVYMVPHPQNQIDLGKGHELWFGLFQSAVLGSRPYLNVDVSHKAFPSGGDLLKLVASFNRGNLDNINQYLLMELQSYIKGMDVIYKSPSGVEKRMRCNGLKDPANQQMFKLDDGTRLSVAEYFAKRLNRPLRFPHLNVLHVGSSVRSVYVPMEFCSVPFGQALNKQHPEECTREIIRHAATNTQVRKDKIMKLSGQINYNNCPTLKNFGIAVGNEFEKVPARIIDAPSLEYANNDQIKPMRGVWRGENKSFLIPSPAATNQPMRWRILNLDQYTNESTVQTFGNMLFQQAKRCNVQMEPFSMQSTYVIVRNDNRNRMPDLGVLMENIKKDKPAITIVVLPSRGDMYAKVKQKAELASERIGLLTQCVKGMTVAKKGTDGSTLNNIMLKINAKTNGSNHRIPDAMTPPLARGKVMYIGADVTHPLNDDTPSVVGVAAMYDLNGFRYNCCVRLQGARDEMIRDLENVVYHQLRLYEQHNKVLPERVMYYRDGVSDGQFAEILTIELQALRAAIARVKPNYKPAVTFIVVQKRHHTRFFPTQSCPTEGRNNNVPPGTIVDREITTPDRYEFYLVSHAAVQGVAKPTKYVVLFDDSNCNPDQLQALTYNLCHMFARCNRSVSYPAPTYYAHLAAYRGRVYIKDRRINMQNLENAYRDIQIIPAVNENNPMFFV